MRALLFLALFGLPLAAAALPAPELTKLEATLTERKKASDDKTITAEAYEDFKREFRAELKTVLEETPRSPENDAVHSRILSALGDHDEAIGMLGGALENSPGEPTLTLALGQAQYENKNYAGALAAAEQVLAKDPNNQGAQLLKHTVANRVQGGGSTSAPLSNTSATSGAAIQNSGSGARQTVVFTEPGKKKGAIVVPGVSDTSSEAPQKKGMPLWPLTVPLGLGIAGAGLYRSKDTANGFGFDPDPNLTDEQRAENRRKGYMVGGALAVGAVAAFAWYTAPVTLPLLRAIPPLISVYGQKVADSVNRLGQSATNLAANESGAIMPESKVVAERLKSLPWQSWASYPKTVYNGRQYAQVGQRLYTQHAVERMSPMGQSYAGRSIPPTYVEEAIRAGTRSESIRNGVVRTLHTSGDIQVVTEDAGRIVITVGKFGSK